MASTSGKTERRPAWAPASLRLQAELLEGDRVDEGLPEGGGARRFDASEGFNQAKERGRPRGGARVEGLERHPKAEHALEPFQVVFDLLHLTVERDLEFRVDLAHLPDHGAHARGKGAQIAFPIVDVHSVRREAPKRRHREVETEWRLDREAAVIRAHELHRVMLLPPRANAMGRGSAGLAPTDTECRRRSRLRR